MSSPHTQLLSRPPRILGTSLLEVIIATAILLGVGLYVIMLVRGGGMRQESFTAEHFTAMFLAQKVLEDINDQVVVNPHFFNELISQASGDAHSVVNGDSPFFRLLENTSGFGALIPGEDSPITPESGPIYNQLKGFSCRVETSFVLDPDNPGSSYQNLLRVKVTISWKDAGGLEQRYAIEQNVYGQNQDVMQAPVHFDPVGEDLIVNALFKWVDPDSKVADGTLEEFLLFNEGGNPEIVTCMGTMLAGLLMCDSTVKEFNGAIDRAEGELRGLFQRHARASEIVTMKEHVAQLKEQRSCTLFGILSRIEPAIRQLEAAPIDGVSLGGKLFSKRKALAGSPLLLLNHSLKISLGFASSEAIYQEVLAPPQFGVSPNRQILLLQHLTDLKKIGLLLSIDSALKPEQRLADFRNSIVALRERYLGKQPGFVGFLDAELKLTASLPDLKRNFSGLHDQLGKIGSLDKPLTRIFERLDPKGTK